ncbi:hypothetical protein G9C85_00170 [Halorubellus sp. JP-L1]|uniref:hypothetical protein n=1 Tax=Halorubellus sp. JP-L1 TaxID=2715753 RepID=UPI0014079BAD|nr:hypothetical protein [Halorubellus sp. JP-L1]NHN40053.1 hypothetical protein [Halorubellus sp. JP-L1]
MTEDTDSRLARAVTHPFTTVTAGLAWVWGFIDPLNALLTVGWQHVGALAGAAGIAESYFVGEVAWLANVPVQQIAMVLAVLYLIRRLMPVWHSLEDRFL